MKSSLLFITLSLGLLVSAVEYNKLVWSDEFNGNSVDTTKWQFEDHCKPQNQELQCYTPRSDNIYVKDGLLHVHARIENRGGKKYTSGRMNTRFKAAWKYGRFEVRAKLPKGDFLWPAFWMLPRDYVYGGWAASGEIDIMEYRGQRTKQVSNALHYGGAWPNNAHVGSGAMDFGTDFSDGFHTFGLIWEKDRMQWLVDGKVTNTRSLTRSWYSGRGQNPYTDIRQPFDQPFFFLINMAIGGNFFGDESQALTTAIASRWANPVMQVDYVRAYAEGGEVNPNPVPVPTSQRTSTTLKTSTSETRPSTSIGVSTAKSSETVRVVSTAASSGVKTAESSGATTFVDPSVPRSSNVVPATSSTSSACAGKCGSGSCCEDQSLGVVCYGNNFECPADPATGKNSLCGKGLGVCNAVCYDKKNYTCSNGKIAQL